MPVPRQLDLVDVSSTLRPDLGRFRTTHWSVVLSARDKTGLDSSNALEILCQTYWYPLYAFVRRQGHSPPDAQDLTQEFFARLLEKNYLQAADRQKGRFRTFLLIVLKRFLANEWDKAKAQKRGGGQQPMLFDTNLAEQRYLGEGASDLSPDRVYERQWAFTLVDRAMRHLREAYCSEGNQREFEALKPCLTADRGEIAYADLASGLGMSEGAARVAVHRMRKRFRTVFREEVAQTVAAADDIDDEVRYLMGALAG
jgi:RNA polymerase sigma-70 factor (ECF subfamily)